MAGWTVLYLVPVSGTLSQVLGAGTLDAYRRKMRFALGNIERAMRGEEPLEQVELG
jgi:hypothetical protein